MPPPSFDDLRRFVEIDTWEELERVRGGAGDHRRYRKVLADGTILRTRVSHGSGEIGDAGLWKRIWRDQLGLDAWLRDRAFPIRNQQGQVYRIVGTATDITEHRTMEAQFIQAFVRVGLAPDSGGSFVLPRLVGHSKALELLLLGDTVPNRLHPIIIPDSGRRRQFQDA